MCSQRNIAARCELREGHPERLSIRHSIVRPSRTRTATRRGHGAGRHRQSVTPLRALETTATTVVLVLSQFCVASKDPPGSPTSSPAPRVRWFPTRGVASRREGSRARLTMFRRAGRSAVSRAYFLLCVAAATADKHRRWYSMARSQIRPRIGVRSGPKVGTIRPPDRAARLSGLFR